MPDDTDAFQLLKIIAGKPALFPAAGEAARKAVNLILGAQLAAEGCDLALAKKLRAAVGAAPFAEAVDGMPTARIKTFLGRVDPLKTGLSAPGDRVKHLLALADGTAAPVAAPAKLPAARKKAAAPAPEPAAQPAEAQRPKRRITGRAALRSTEAK